MLPSDTESAATPDRPPLTYGDNSEKEQENKKNKSFEY